MRSFQYFILMTKAFSVTSFNHNKLHKIQTIVDHLRSKFKETVASETFQAIDEMMVPLKGKHGAKICLPKKPIKWGDKVWHRAKLWCCLWRCNYLWNGYDLHTY